MLRFYFTHMAFVLLNFALTVLLPAVAKLCTLLVLTDDSASTTASQDPDLNGHMKFYR